MINQAKSTLLKKGFLDIPVESTSLAEDILQLKKKKNAVVLAHFYQEAPIQDIADFVGDSLELSRKAKETEADIIVFCGVHFMAETAKIVNPQKKVLLPDLNAGCSLSDSCPPDAFAAFKKLHPEAITISYINCSADIKAQSDIICTSSNATLIVNSVPKNKEIIFAPDKNLGRYVEQQTGRKLILWDGACVVHEEFSLKKSQELLALNPDAKFISHPEAIQEVLEVADFVGSTSQLLKFVQNDDAQKYVVATENGIFHQMKKAAPEKIFITAACNNCIKTCVCGECDYMKMNTLEKVFLCLKYELPEITVEEKIRQQAEKSLNRMIELSQSIK